MIYSKYIEIKEENQDLRIHFQDLNHDVKYTIEFLDLRNKQIQRIFEREHAILNTFQASEHMSDNMGMATCPNCIAHRTTLKNQREFNSRNSDAARATHIEMEALIENSKKDLNSELIKNGKLRAELMCTKDSFWKSRELLLLKDSCSKMECNVQDLQKFIEQLRKEREEYCQEMIRTLQSKSAGIRAKKAESLDPLLLNSRDSSFMILENDDENETDGNKLYDVFFNTMLHPEQELNLNLLYQMEHDGAHIPKRELDNFKKFMVDRDGKRSRPCKNMSPLYWWNSEEEGN